MKIYFAGSIRGGRDDRGIYLRIIRHLQKSCEVLTEHVGDDGLSPSGETGMSDREIHDRDMTWLAAADVVVAEVTNPSLGVGYEIASAISMKKRVVCLFRNKPGSRLSAMIAGSPDVEAFHYELVEEAFGILDKLLK